MEDTAAIVVSEDLNDFVPLAPEMETVVVLPTAIGDATALAVMDWAALLILKVAVLVPVYLPFPVMVTVAVPASMLLEYDIV